MIFHFLVLLTTLTDSTKYGALLISACSLKLNLKGASGWKMAIQRQTKEGTKGVNTVKKFIVLNQDQNLLLRFE